MIKWTRRRDLNHLYMRPLAYEASEHSELLYSAVAVGGIEPPRIAYETTVLPLNYTAFVVPPTGFEPAFRSLEDFRVSSTLQGHEPSLASRPGTVKAGSPTIFRDSMPRNGIQNKASVRGPESSATTIRPVRMLSLQISMMRMLPLHLV